jgi:AhpD family alkylhydroperoxidase
VTLTPEEFAAERARLNERVLATNHRVVKRLYSLDTLAYEEGALSKPTKELLGLVASLVLRCDDCVRYHLGRCVELGTTRNEILDALSVGLVVGGTIVVPHLRRAVEYLDLLLDAPRAEG